MELESRAGTPLQEPRRSEVPWARSPILHQPLAPGAPLGKSEARQASGLLGSRPLAPRVAGAQEAQGTRGRGLGKLFQATSHGLRTRLLLLWAPSPRGAGPWGGAVGDWGLVTPKRPGCPSGSLPRRAPDPRASLSSPFPQGPVPSQDGAPVAGQRPPKALGTKRSPEKARRTAAPRARCQAPQL